MIQQDVKHVPHAAEVTLRDVANVIFRHKKTIQTFFICVFVIVALITFLMPKTYQSSAQLMLRLGRENASLDPTIIGTAINVSDSRENEINSELEMLKSHELAEKVVETIGVNRVLGIPANKVKKYTSSIDSLSHRENAIQVILRNISVSAIQKTNIITISYCGSDPKTVQEIIANLITLYQEKHMAIYRPSGTYKFFEEQTDTLKSQLKANEDSILKIKNTTGITSVDAQCNDILSRISAMQLELNRVRADLASSRAKNVSMNQNIKNMPSIISAQKIGGTTSSSSDLLRTKLNDLRLKKQELLTKYNEESRPVRDIETQIQETQSLLDKEDFDNSRSNAVREIQMTSLSEVSNVAALAAKEKSLTNMLSAATAELKKFNGNSIELSRLQLIHENYERNFAKYNDNLEQARIDHELKASKFSNVGIVQNPTLPFKPIKPKKLYNLILGLFFGLFGGLCIAFVLEFLDHTIKRREDVETYLKLPALGVLPVIPSDASAHPWIVPTACSETFEMIWSVLNKPDQKTHPKVLAVTSCYPMEGTSTIATYLSGSLVAHIDKAKVLIVDCNIISPSMHTTFGVPSSPGFSDYFTMSNQSQGIIPMHQKDVPETDILPAGSLTLQPLRTVQSKWFLEMLSSWKNEYEYIILDMPSMTQSPLAIELAEIIDGTILVVEAEKVRREVIAQSVKNLTRARNTVLGVVLNKRKFYMPTWAYKIL